MCLHKITELEKPEESGIAWKVFVKDDLFLHPPLWPSYVKHGLTVGKTYKHSECANFLAVVGAKITSSSNILEKYLRGWHCFENREDAITFLNLAQREEYFRNANLALHKINWVHQLARGTQNWSSIVEQDYLNDQFPVIVVEEMTIGEEYIPSAETEEK